MLAEGELCACEITDVLGLAPSTISAHLAELRTAGLIVARKTGRWVYFRRDPALGPELLADLDLGIPDDPRLSADAIALDTLRRAGPANRCGPGEETRRLGPVMNGPAASASGGDAHRSPGSARS